MSGWICEDISSKLDTRGQQYNFISKTFARVYKNSKGEEILLMILDAGNFHNPKVCYGSSGYITNDLNAASIELPDRKFLANTVYLEKEETHLTMLYWLCIDKKLVSWTGQKVQELFATIFNRKKAGLMVRLDVPCNRDNKPAAILLAQSFVRDLSAQLSLQDRDYLFGK
jgi:EpsI family protein